MGYSLWRGMHCVLGGYAELPSTWLEKQLQFSHNAVEFLTMFPPFALQHTPSYEDFLALLRTPVGGYNRDGPTVYIWNFGIWMISFVPSSDWTRGLDTIMQYVARYAAESLATAGERQRHYFNTVTSFQTAENNNYWQTARRAHSWNEALLRLARKHRVTVVDLHSPTTVRYDARTDNCHYCDTVMYELAHITLRSVVVGSENTAVAVAIQAKADATGACSSTGPHSSVLRL